MSISPTPRWPRLAKRSNDSILKACRMKSSSIRLVKHSDSSPQSYLPVLSVPILINCEFSLSIDGTETKSSSHSGIDGSLHLERKGWYLHRLWDRENGLCTKISSILLLWMLHDVILSRFIDWSINCFQFPGFGLIRGIFDHYLPFSRTFFWLQLILYSDETTMMNR